MDDAARVLFPALGGGDPPHQLPDDQTGAPLGESVDPPLILPGAGVSPEADEELDIASEVTRRIVGDEEEEVAAAQPAAAGDTPALDPAAARFELALKNCGGLVNAKLQEIHLSVMASVQSQGGPAQTYHQTSYRLGKAKKAAAALARAESERAGKAVEVDPAAAGGSTAAAAGAAEESESDDDRPIAFAKGDLTPLFKTHLLFLC